MKNLEENYISKNAGPLAIGGLGGLMIARHYNNLAKNNANTNHHHHQGAKSFLSSDDSDNSDDSDDKPGLIHRLFTATKDHLTNKINNAYENFNQRIDATKDDIYNRYVNWLESEPKDDIYYNDNRSTISSPNSGASDLEKLTHQFDPIGQFDPRYIDGVTYPQDYI